MRYKIKIDGKPFNYVNQFISGEKIRKIGNLLSTQKIWFKVNRSELKLEINNSDTIDLGGDGTEEFYTTT